MDKAYFKIDLPQSRTFPITPIIKKKEKQTNKQTHKQKNKQTKHTNKKTNKHK